MKTHGRLDVLVNSIAGEQPLMGQWGSFWQVDVVHADQVIRQALVSHIVTAKHVVPVMIELLHFGSNDLCHVIQRHTRS